MFGGSIWRMFMQQNEFLEHLFVLCGRRHRLVPGLEREVSAHVIYDPVMTAEGEWEMNGIENEVHWRLSDGEPPDAYRRGLLK